MECVELPAQWRLTWHASPLDENPDVIEFHFWHELEDWVADKEATIDCFDLELCIIEGLG